MSSKILIVDDEPFNLDLLQQELTDLGYAIERADDGAQALLQVDKADPELVLLDYRMPDMNGIEVLQAIRKGKPNLPVVIITAHGSIERAVEAIKAGADDFITKPFDPEHLALVVRRNLERSKLRADVEFFAAEFGERHHLITGSSPAMLKSVAEAQKAAASRSTILLLGESGTGKELFARSIHAWSERRRKPFVAINCAGLAKEMLESELFGHEKGAFTGAYQLKKGKLELAHQGTVFLDEIGDLTLELQTKLLRVLQEREFERVGGTALIQVDLRIIAATNRDLEAAVKGGSFRDDLYHRLNVIALTLPPLRHRKDDIPTLAHYFLERFAAETKKNFSLISDEARERLVAYDWPGNTRELANVIERAVVLGDGPQLTLHHLPARVINQPAQRISSLSITRSTATGAS
jgi:DNA-binding NtrC family response regulator